jgi:hypothetical protein
MSNPGPPACHHFGLSFAQTGGGVRSALARLCALASVTSLHSPDLARFLFLFCFVMPIAYSYIYIFICHDQREFAVVLLCN